MHPTSERNFLPEEDSSEAHPSEGEFEEDEVAVDKERDDQKEQEGQIDQEQGKAQKVGLGESPGHGERFRWHTVSVNGREKVLDLKLLESYMKVISHGGTDLTLHHSITFFLGIHDVRFRNLVEKYTLAFMLGLGTRNVNTLQFNNIFCWIS